MPDLRAWLGAAVAVAVGSGARDVWAQPSMPPDDSFFEAGEMGPSAAPPPSPAATANAEGSETSTYEPPAPPFGARGELVVTGASSVGISSQTFDSSQARNFSVTFSPGLDWFVARNVSIGITGDVSYVDGQGYGADGSLVDNATTTWSVGPRVGINLPLGERFSFYPRIAVGFESVHHEERLVSGNSLSTATSPLGYPTTTQFGPWASVYAPLLFHPKPHLFVGFGPSLFQDFGHAQGGPDIGGQRTEVGAGFVVGGWWGGEADPRQIEDAPPPPEKPRPHRFGLAQQFVLDSGLGLSAYDTSYAGTSSSVTTVGFEPGIDYFFVNHVSFGLAGYVTSYASKGIDPSTSQSVAYTHSSQGMLMRLGVDVPLGPWLSLYPRASIGLGGDSYDETSGSSENKLSDTVSWVGLDAPLLVHAASHLFVGLGPTIAHDLDRSFPVPNVNPQFAPGGSAPSIENRSTTVGASLIVGGWIDI